MKYFCIILGAAFFIFGLLFACGKIHTHLQLWKHMSVEEKEKIKIHSLCLNIGEVIMLNGIIFLLRGIFSEGSSGWFTITIVAWMIVAGFDVWFISKSKKYINR
ncbi:MAG: DUF3784 domain-containing protein [Clostridiales bacterium]|nr:DUF3784 domain-containing protein [Clostridiales bacterium]